jgi:hypothetical protein
MEASPPSAAQRQERGCEARQRPGEPERCRRWGGCRRRARRSGCRHVHGRHGRDRDHGHGCHRPVCSKKKKQMRPRIMLGQRPRARQLTQGKAGNTDPRHKHTKQTRRKREENDSVLERLCGTAGAKASPKVKKITRSILSFFFATSERQEDDLASAGAAVVVSKPGKPFLFLRIHPRSGTLPGQLQSKIKYQMQKRRSLLACERGARGACSQPLRPTCWKRGCLKKMRSMRLKAFSGGVGFCCLNWRQ